MSSQPAPRTTHDHTTLFPEEVAARLGFSSDSIATIEVTNTSSYLYCAILEYTFYYGAPLEATEIPATEEGESILRSVWNCPEDKYETDAESDDGSDGEEDVSDAAMAMSHELASIGIEFDRLDGVLGRASGLRKKKVPVARWQAGLGYAKLSVNGATVYLYHYVFGKPVSDTFGIQMFRAITLAGDDVVVLRELCRIALKWRHEREQSMYKTKQGRYALYRFKVSPQGCSEWANQGHKRARPASSVILPKGQLHSIINDVRDFMSSTTKKWYQAHGLPHRRSLLFHGVPGSGKTSSIRVLAGLFKLNACFLSLTGQNFNNQALQDAMSSIPDRALLVVEDCDALFNEDRKTEGPAAVTFSAFLNCLDGLSSTDGIITVLTTNHIEKLDPALIRGGRVDRRFEFLRPDQEQIAELFLSFYKEASRELAVKFAKCVFERKESEARSIATLQQHFIFTRMRSAEECVEALPKFFTEFYPRGATERQTLYM